MNFQDNRERLDYDPSEFVEEAREMAKKEANGPEYVSIYFDLTNVDHETPHDEFHALDELGSMFMTFVHRKGINNEGHDCYDALVCSFVVGNNRKTLTRLQNFIEKNHGGGDDHIYLSLGYVASNFTIVPEPGRSKPIEFEDWNEYIESL